MEIEKEMWDTQRERRKWHHQCRAKIGDEFTLSREWRHHCRTKIGNEFIHFPLTKIALFVSLPKIHTFRFSLHTSRLSLLKWSPLWRWNSQWVLTFHCQKISPSLFRLSQVARLFFPSKKWIKLIPKTICRSQSTNQSGEQNERLPDLCFSICRFSRVVFIPRAQPHAQSLFLFPIVFGINTVTNQVAWKSQFRRKCLRYCPFSRDAPLKKLALTSRLQLGILPFLPSSRHTWKTVRSHVHVLQEQNWKGLERLEELHLAWLNTFVLTNLVGYGISNAHSALVTPSSRKKSQRKGTTKIGVI